jgi:hypothetical protein
LWLSWLNQSPVSAPVLAARQLYAPAERSAAGRHPLASAKAYNRRVPSGMWLELARCDLRQVRVSDRAARSIDRSIVLLLLYLRRSHGEGTAWNNHHLRTSRAVLELLGLAHARLETSSLILPCRDLYVITVRDRQSSVALVATSVAHRSTHCASAPTLFANRFRHDVLVGAKACGLMASACGNIHGLVADNCPTQCLHARCLCGSSRRWQPVLLLTEPRQTARKLCGVAAWFFALLAILWAAHLSDKYL